MLQQMREMKMFVFWFVAIVFVVGFVFLSDGLNVGKLESRDKNVVVDVNGQKVDYAAYNRYVTYYVDMERRQSQRDDLSSAEYDRIEDQAWNDMITDLLMRQEAERLGFDVLWSVEHHFNDYSFCPDNLQLMSYLAAACPRVGLGTAAFVVAPRRMVSAAPHVRGSTPVI